MSRPCREDIIGDAMAHAAGLGVDLVVEWQDDQQRLTFMVERHAGAPGSGEMAIAHLLELADGAELEVAIDVLQSIPALIRYYWRFGFRAFSDEAEGREGEMKGLEALERQRQTYLSKPGNDADGFGVTFMWREPPRPETRLAA